MELTKKDKILFLPAWYPTKSDHIAGISIQRLAQLTNKEYDVTVMYINGAKLDGEKYEIIQQNEDGLNVIRLLYHRENVNSTASLLQKIYFAFWHFYLVIKGFRLIHKKIGKPSLLHVHVLTRNGIIAYFYQLIYGVKYCITERWSRYFTVDGTYNGFLKKKITAFVVRKSSGVATVSNALKLAMEEHSLGHSVFKIIPNVVDKNLFYYPGFDTHLKRPKFIHVSCFNDRDKNITGIIRTAHQLDSAGFSFDLDLIGDGKDRSDLQNLVNGLTWKNVSVSFEGEKFKEDLASIYQTATALIVFSNYETFCIVVAEAHCCGLPVIATDVGAIPELIDYTNGLLVPIKDEKALAFSMIDFIENKVSFDRQQISDQAMKLYSDTAVIEKIREFYQMLP